MIFRLQSRRLRGLWETLFLLLTSLMTFIAADKLTDAQIDAVSARLTETARKSWELGTLAQTILERNATTYSVFSGQSLPPPSTVPSPEAAALEPFFNIARTVVRSRPMNRTGPRPLMPDDSAADPASIGVCVLIANWTKAGDLDYAGAAKSQIDYLFTMVPRTSDGAISHRVSQIQLWSDFVYMVPPFLAYYGVTTRNRTMLRESYNQIRLYRKYLRDSRKGMWRHILLGTYGNDSGFWSTGNGWAAAGMLRVYATMKYSEYANTFKNELENLASWVHEIHAGIYPHLDNSSIFTNYADRPDSFYDAASTALLASTVYRAAKLINQETYIPYAERSRKALYVTTSSSESGATLFPSYIHFTNDGALTPVVDPYMYGSKAMAVTSPEGQAFVVQMHVAWKEWQVQVTSANAATANQTFSSKVIWTISAVVGLLTPFGSSTSSH